VFSWTEVLLDRDPHTTTSTDVSRTIVLVRFVLLSLGNFDGVSE
jgi:hypothetical protein